MEKELVKLGPQVDDGDEPQGRLGCCIAVWFNSAKNFPRGHTLLLTITHFTVVWFAQKRAF